MRERIIDDIEILRGMAVLMVVIHHAEGNLIPWSTSALKSFYSYFGGWVGVDLFFAVSGFVIARSLVPQLLREGCTPRSRVVLAFWLRRAWRLFPSAWLWLFVVLVASLFFNNSKAFGTFEANLEATFAGVLQVANLRFAETFMQHEYGASFVYWSLSLEEQFYLLFPLLVLLSRRYLPLLMIGIVVVQFFSERSLLLMVFRTDALAMGVLIALWSSQSSYRRLRPELLARCRMGVCVCFTLLVLLALLGSERLQIVSIRCGLIALLAAALVWIASYDGNFLCPTGQIRRFFLWLGSRSYAIYLIHVPAFFCAREIWFRSNPGGDPAISQPYSFLVVVAVLLIVVLSELNYRLVEKPFREKGRCIARRLQGESKSTVAHGGVSIHG